MYVVGKVPRIFLPVLSVKPPQLELWDF